MPRRVCLISDALWPPFDEGMKVFARQLARYLGARYEFLAVTDRGADDPALKVRSLGFSKTLGSAVLARTLRDFAPEVLVYLPHASVTTSSFLRVWRLRRILPSAKLVLIGLQHREHSAPARWLIRRLHPGPLLVQGGYAADYFARLGMSPRTIPSGVDVDKYRPLTPGQKKMLRAKYDIPESVFLLSHVGHLRRSRNTDLLAQACRLPDTRVLMIASSHADPDPTLRTALRKAGVDVRDEYFGDLEEIYQMSDAYLFPVMNARGAIGMPLSVIEALACDTPVISSPFGELEKRLPPSDAVRYIRGFDDLARSRAALAQGIRPGSARALALPYAWDRVFDEHLREVLSP